MRKCWNWQTGMTKDHVVPDREGSSPFFRIAYKPRYPKGFRGFLRAGKVSIEPPVQTCMREGRNANAPTTERLCSEVRGCAKHRLYAKESHAGKFSRKNRSAFL